MSFSSSTRISFALAFGSVSGKCTSFHVFFFFKQKKKGFEFFSGMNVIQESWKVKNSKKKKSEIAILTLLFFPIIVEFCVFKDIFISAWPLCRALILLLNGHFFGTAGQFFFSEDWSVKKRISYYSFLYYQEKNIAIHLYLHLYFFCLILYIH